MSCILCPASCVRVLCPVFCVLHPASCILRPASCVRLCTLCVTIVSAMPSNHCTGPLCIAPSCRLCICCTFSAITISDILPQSNSKSRSHVPCPALRVLSPLSCVLSRASCFASDYALCPLCSYLHVLYLLRRVHAPLPPLCHLLHRTTLLRYNGLSCRMAIPSAAPRLFRRYSLEFNQSKVPSAVKPENPNRCSILCKRLKPALLHFCCRFRYCFFEQSIRKILTFALFGYKIKS